MHTYKIVTNIEKLIKWIEKIQNNGWTFQELTNWYMFSVKGIKWWLSWNKDKINKSKIILSIQITDKPFLISWSLIESNLLDFFE